jgi:hypothetical protein
MWLGYLANFSDIMRFGLGTPRSMHGNLLGGWLGSSRGRKSFASTCATRLFSQAPSFASPVLIYLRSDITTAPLTEADAR